MRAGVLMAGNAFDYPNTTLVDSEGNVVPVWDQWFNRIQSVSSAAQQSGTTANRPTSGLWIGRRYFDTTLNAPVWVQSVRPTVWVTAGGGGGGPVADGDYGDVTVSGIGTIWTIDNDVVTYAKMQNVSTNNRLLGRATGGAGDVEEITLGTNLSFTGTTLNAAGGAGATWTEVEIDFGVTPVYDATFTITDAAITSSAVKMILVPSGKAATGRTADDWQWDGGTFVANPGTGAATCYATFAPGPIVGRRTLQYQVT